MPHPSRPLRLLGLVLAGGLALGLGLLALRPDPALRAERHFRAGQALEAAGDLPRALVEYRTVFDLDGGHLAARLAYARGVLAEGETAEARGQFLRLIADHPQAGAATLEAHLRLAELALLRGDLAQARSEIEAAGRIAAEPDGSSAFEVPPDLAADLRAAGIALAFQEARARGDAAGAARAAAEAEGLLRPATAPRPGAPPPADLARRVVIDQRLAEGDTARLLPLLEEAAQTNPRALEFPLMTLQILIAAGDPAAVEAQLDRMIARFPDSAELRRALLAWHLGRHDAAGAEAALRRLLAGTASGPDPATALALAEVVHLARGPAAAAAELRALAGSGPEADALLLGLAATLDYEAGDPEGAIAATEALLSDLGTQGTRSDRIRGLEVILARMRDGLGQRPAAEALVARVLTEDPGQSEALKLRAAWRIGAGDPGAALLDLAAALDQDPADPAILILMAEAHAQAGAVDLAGERLARAVEVSGAAAGPALLRAGHLQAEGRLVPALAVLGAARDRAPGHPALLGAIASLWLASGDWTRLEDLARELSANPAPEAQDQAARLRAEMAAVQARQAELRALLSELDGVGPPAARGVLAELQAGRLEAATRNLAAARARTDATDPDAPLLSLLQAAALDLAGDAPAAEIAWRAVLDDPQAARPLAPLAARSLLPPPASLAELAAEALHGLLLAQDRAPEARALLGQARARLAPALRLDWLEAGWREAEGDIAGAIRLSEALQAAAPDNPVMRNNLASLLATHRAGDPAARARAIALAAPLAGLEDPVFQETWGWTRHLAGDPAGLPALRAAAAALPGDPLTQAHFGLAAEGPAPEEARAALLRAGALPDHLSALRAEVEAALTRLGPGSCRLHSPPDPADQGHPSPACREPAP